MENSLYARDDLLLKAFRIFDLNNDGNISVGEFVWNIMACVLVHSRSVVPSQETISMQIQKYEETLAQVVARCRQSPRAPGM